MSSGRNILQPVKEFFGAVRMPDLQIWSLKNCSPKENNLLSLNAAMKKWSTTVKRVAVSITDYGERGKDIFLEINTVSGYTTQFPEIITPVNWFPVPIDIKVRGLLICSLACLNFFRQSLARIKSRYVNVALITK